MCCNGWHGLRSPGIYSWWVDDAGAADLTTGLGHQIDAGLIYAGLAGATHSGGSPSSNTLWGRIATMHLGKSHEFSTLRRTLGSILASADQQLAINEVHLTRWMHAHLQVIAIPVADVDTLGDLETEILAALDPPLNLAKVGGHRFADTSRRYASNTPAPPSRQGSPALKFRRRNLEALADLVVATSAAMTPRTKTRRGTSRIGRAATSPSSSRSWALTMSMTAPPVIAGLPMSSRDACRAARRPTHPPEIFCRLIDQLMSPADALNEGPDRPRALAT